MTSFKKLMLCNLGLILSAAPVVARADQPTKTQKMKCVETIQELSKEMEGVPELALRVKKLQVKILDDKADKISVEEEGKTSIYTQKSKFTIKSAPIDKCEEDTAASETSDTKLRSLYDEAMKEDSKETDRIRSKKKALMANCPSTITGRKASLASDEAKPEIQKAKK